MQVAWAAGTEWEVAAGMLDIFHKLPGQAKKFLETNGGPRPVLRGPSVFLLCCFPSSFLSCVAVFLSLALLLSAMARCCRLNWCWLLLGVVHIAVASPRQITPTGLLLPPPLACRGAAGHCSADHWP